MIFIYVYININAYNADEVSTSAKRLLFGRRVSNLNAVAFDCCLRFDDGKQTDDARGNSKSEKRYMCEIAQFSHHKSQDGLKAIYTFVCTFFD